MLPHWHFVIKLGKFDLSHFHVFATDSYETSHINFTKFGTINRAVGLIFLFELKQNQKTRHRRSIGVHFIRLLAVPFLIVVRAREIAE